MENGKPKGITKAFTQEREAGEISNSSDIQ